MGGGNGRAFSTLQCGNDPVQQMSADLAAVDLIEHFVPAARVEIVRNVGDARLAIPVHQDADALELLAHWIVTAGKQVDGKIAADPAKTNRIGHARRRLALYNPAARKRRT